MAGHSHWANIKHKKAANDAKKAKVITQMGRLIKAAVGMGGPDEASNPRLRLAIQKARAQNMTRDAIDRAVSRAAGDGTGKPMEELSYEGYGAGGVAVVVNSLTDNRNRTAPEVKKLFERGGGNMGAPGCVSWQFHDKSVFLVDCDDEDTIMEALLNADADAEDIVITPDGKGSITAALDQFQVITEALEQAKLAVLSSDLTKIAENDCVVDDPDVANKVLNLIEKLEDHEDVSEVYSNFVPAESIADSLA